MVLINLPQSIFTRPKSTIIVHLANSLCFLLFLFLSLPLSSKGNSGDLDLTFGLKGTVRTTIPGGGGFASGANGMALQNDGKIVLTGYEKFGAVFKFVTARFTTDGSLDPSFGMGGFAITQFGPGDSYGYAVAIQNDGKIIAAGVTTNENVDIAIARYNTDGSFDDSFGNGGKIIAQIGNSHDRAFDVKVLSDGKILVCGTTNNTGTLPKIAVLRLLSTGVLDNAFGIGGVTTIAVTASFNIAQEMAVQSDGKIVVAGYNTSPDPSDFLIVRFTAAGQIDTDFGTNGAVLTDMGGVDTLRSVAIQPDGKIVVAGETNQSPFLNLAIARYLPNGLLDNTFNGNGKIITRVNSNSFNLAYAIAIQPNGKILVAGGTVLGNFDFAVLRFTPDGSPDVTFNQDGQVTTDLGSREDIAFSIAIQPNGKFLVAGSSYIDSPMNRCFGIARYKAFNDLAVINGRATYQSGTGFGKAHVTLTGGDLTQPLRALTNPFGYYQFPNLPTGRSYTVNITAKGAAFLPSSQSVDLQDDLTAATFVAQ